MENVYMLIFPIYHGKAGLMELKTYDTELECRRAASELGHIQRGIVFTSKGNYMCVPVPKPD